MLARHAPELVEAVDFCPQMIRQARAEVERRGMAAVRVAEQDVLTLPGEPAFDRIACSFGLKTLDDAQLEALAGLVAAVLRPGGVAAFVEIGVPRFLPLRIFFLAYLRHVIPAIGWLFLGRPACYRWLGRYTEDFARRDRFATQLRAAGLRAVERRLFFGCAKLYRAERPELEALAERIVAVAESAVSMGGDELHCRE